MKIISHWVIFLSFLLHMESGAAKAKPKAKLKPTLPVAAYAGFYLNMPLLTLFDTYKNSRIDLIKGEYFPIKYDGMRFLLDGKFGPELKEFTPGKRAVSGILKWISGILVVAVQPQDLKDHIHEIRVHLKKGVQRQVELIFQAPHKNKSSVCKQRHDLVG